MGEATHEGLGGGSGMEWAVALGSLGAKLCALATLGFPNIEPWEEMFTGGHD